MFAAEIRKRRIVGTRLSRWHLDEMFVKINGDMHCWWRVAEPEAEILENLVTRTRERKAALESLGKAKRKHGRAEVVVADRLRFYGAAPKEIGAADRQGTGRWSNYRVENSSPSFIRGERALHRFRRMRSVQEFADVHASAYNHCN
jgi:putative transposase